MEANNTSRFTFQATCHDTHESLFGKGPAVVAVLENDKPRTNELSRQEAPIAFRVLGIANSLEEASQLVESDVKRIEGSFPTRPELMPSEYELHIARDGEYVCLGHTISMVWPEKVLGMEVAR